MLKGAVIWAFMITILSFTAASSNFNAKNYTRDSQIVLKSLVEFRQQGHLYKPLRVHTKVIEESFNNYEINKKLQSALEISANILSDLLLTKPSTDKIRLSGNNQCTDIIFGQIVQSEDLEADIAIFAINNEEKGEIIATKKCEMNENKTVKSMALEINAEKLLKLDEFSQVKELCIAISNVLYEDSEGEKQVLLSEIGGILAKEREVKIVSILGACQAGQAGCQTCDDTNTDCIACSDGYFLSGEACTACQSPCAQCNGAATFCTACDDANHMINNAGTCSCTDADASFNDETLTCQCNAGTACTACSSNCATCTGAYTNCVTCVDTTHMTAAPTCACPANGSLQGNTCACNTGYYFSTNTVCLACNTNCDSCTTSAENCVTCSDTTHMSEAPTCTCPANSILQETTCVCNAGYFFSSNTICTACNTNCATCTTNAENCLTCIDPIHMSAPTCSCPTNSALQGTTCACNAGFFYSNNICTACSYNCATCTTTAENCETCTDVTHMSVAPACACPNKSIFFDVSCFCIIGYYYSSNTVCSACTPPCSECSTSATTCTACEYGNYLSGNTCLTCSALCFTCLNSANTCTACNNGYYLSGNTCLLCTTPCATCITSATYCTRCEDLLNMTLVDGVCKCNSPNASFSTTSKMCVCNAGYFDNAGVCAQCTSPCKVCTSATVCQGCIDGYWVNGQACAACTPPCSKCSTSGTTCSACVAGTILNAADGTCSCNDPNASFNNNNGACICNPGYFEDAGACAACDNLCATCSGTATNCLSCIDEYYLDKNACFACSLGCKVCTGTFSCTQCVDDSPFSTLKNGICGCSDPNQDLNALGFCVCDFGYFSAKDKCSACNTGCKVCSSETTCSTCYDLEYGVISADGSCTCKLTGQTYDATYQICLCYDHSYPNFEEGNCERCSMGCSACTSMSCVQCYDPFNMQAENNGSCSCILTNMTFSNSTDKCVYREDSAIELTFSWIMIISAMIFSF